MSGIKQGLKAIAASLGYEIRGTRMTPRLMRDPAFARPLEFDDLICRRIFETDRPLNFIQVGAFDGQVQDPLRRYIVRETLRGVMVEPQPGPASKLRALYKGNNRITVLQAALDSASGVRPFFGVEAPDPGHWAGALASFDKTVILKHANMIPGLERMIRAIDVDCITFETALSHLPSPELDLLQIDTEGADAYVLSLFPFERIKPAIIQWEVRHLSFKEREDSLERLAGHGYRFAPSGTQDMLAVLVEG